jgi:hypothetical protein
MLISTAFLAKASKTYNDAKKKQQKVRERYKELYDNGVSVGQSIGRGISTGFELFILMIAVVFFLLELVVLFYSIMMAMACTKPGAERVVHVTLSIIFTFPYALIAIFFSPCAKSVLQGNGRNGRKK